MIGLDGQEISKEFTLDIESFSTIEWTAGNQSSSVAHLSNGNIVIISDISRDGKINYWRDFSKMATEEI